MIKTEAHYKKGLFQFQILKIAGFYYYDCGQYDGSPESMNIANKQ